MNEKPGTTTGTLAVPGATLYYETRGSGPLLLLISGGAGDAGMYAGMFPALAAEYTVVTYDPRALSRSTLDGPLTDQQVQVWSDDARRLLDHLAPGEEAGVMGCSSGAVVALDLLARHPERLRRVVVHEPPLVELLPEPAPYRALFAEVRDTYRAEGLGPAMARFSEGIGEPVTPEEAEQATELPPEVQEMAPRMHANFPVFLEHMLCPFSSSVPDLEALRPVAHKLVPAAGRLSRTQEPFYGPAARLAELFGIPLVEFPGGHLGSVDRSKEFGEQLLKALA
ncbi:alpha/beta hydrolase [Streptomyces rectiverticillatus]|uniref:alpha/beta fold hydrolase n=1 Tax=Streptomyces rectiverticillatus TaxID=173860 RepID=UPI0015C37F2B|nr:alpha/beta hydrolase [Streptomyces rectiverticillatus]QLE70502.1 alpha/beta hydrolase [Streptomyces rectiverticillatus]